MYALWSSWNQLESKCVDYFLTSTVSYTTAGYLSVSSDTLKIAPDSTVMTQPLRTALHSRRLCF